MAPSKTAMKIQSANVGPVPTLVGVEELFITYSLSQEKEGDKSLDLMPANDIRKKSEISELIEN
jgi:hypothetical protein